MPPVDEGLIATANSGSFSTGAVLPEFGDCVEINRARLIQFEGTVIRTGTSIPDSVGLRIGTQSMSKEAYRIVVRSVRFSGEGERNIGICAEPSFVSDNESEFFALHFGMLGADNDDFIDVVLSEATGTVRTYYGHGSPEGVVTALPGSGYFDLDGGAGVTFYVKETGSGNTGWDAK